MAAWFYKTGTMTLRLKKRSECSLGARHYAPILVYAFLQPICANANSKAASVSPLSTNPASSAFLEKHSSSLSITPISSNDVKLRYVGSEGISKKSESPLTFSDAQPGFALKPMRRVSFGIGEVLPPVSVKRDIDDVPIVVLNDVSLVDLKVNATVKYGLSLFGGYLLNDRLAVGGGFASRQILVNAVANTNNGEKLFNGKFLLTTTTLNLGANFLAQKNKLRLGVATSVFSSNGIKASIETPLASGPGTQSLNNNSTEAKLIFGDFIFGAELEANPLATLCADVVWKRADKSQKEFSIVDLQEKPKDVYDTVSVFANARYKAQEKQFAIAGFSYEPAPIGGGSKGATGKSGFGMKETALLYSGMGDLLPAWSVSLGLQYGDGLPTINDDEPTKPKGKRSKADQAVARRNERQDIWDRLTFSVSLRYRRASLGIDETGELPAAYSQTRLQFPVSIQSTF